MASVAWVVFSVFGMLPFVLCGTPLNVSEAFFRGAVGAMDYVVSHARWPSRDNDHHRPVCAFVLALTRFAPSLRGATTRRGWLPPVGDGVAANLAANLVRFLMECNGVGLKDFL
jgi:hypothetical protein